MTNMTWNEVSLLEILWKDKKGKPQQQGNVHILIRILISPGKMIRKMMRDPFFFVPSLLHTHFLTRTRTNYQPFAILGPSTRFGSEFKNQTTSAGIREGRVLLKGRRTWASIEHSG